MSCNDTNTIQEISYEIYFNELKDYLQRRARNYDVALSTYVVVDIHRPSLGAVYKHNLCIGLQRDVFNI